MGIEVWVSMCTYSVRHKQQPSQVKNFSNYFQLKNFSRNFYSALTWSNNNLQCTLIALNSFFKAAYIFKWVLASSITLKNGLDFDHKALKEDNQFKKSMFLIRDLFRLEIYTSRTN
jgi:hypothetical protein